MKKTKKLVVRIKKKHLHASLAISVVVILFMLIKVFWNSPGLKQESEVVRQPAVAGSWYPGTENTLTETIKSYITNAQPQEINGRIKALIVPHAGYRFSGLVAAYGFKQLKKDYDTVIVIGPSHHATFRGASIANVTHYRTPLGKLKLSKKASQLRKEDMFSSIESVHLREHSVEIELPFVQYILGDVELIPIIIGPNTNYEEAKKIAETLKKYVDKKTLIIASSDFTHYGPNYGYVPFTENKAENIKKLDEKALSYIKKLDAEGFYEHIKKTGATICGYLPITVLLELLHDDNIKVQQLAYDTSGRQLGDYTNSVSYVTVAFFSQESVSEKDQEFLLKLARKTLELYLAEGKTPKINEDLLSEELTTVKGCFVTLEKHHQLRGCIGHIVPREPLYKCVIDNAVNAAVNDVRFPKVKYDELKDIEIEISVLTVPEEVSFNSPEELLNKLRPNVDGVIIRSGWHQATYLPQVWENFPNKENFLSSLCQKGGAPRDCWKSPSTKVFSYQAQVFREK